MLRFSFRRAASRLTVGLCAALLACSGSGGVTGPGGDDPGPGPIGPGPGPGNPGPGDPGPGDPGPGQPGFTYAGIYQLTAIDDGKPGQMIAVANPDGILIGLYRFLSGTIEIDPLGGFSLSIEYEDDKATYVLEDEGEYKWHAVEGGVSLNFSSDTYGDEFEGAAAPDGSSAIDYDFDGDGRLDIQFGFQQVAGGLR